MTVKSSVKSADSYLSRWIW